ncbi:hypothetical protein CASFOL_010046 [Castilleja foliolosa]|uniref:FAF domain-containing protein n=1 Tax=Castilleja foliolosa TaxID=1961234 RepID=A0ABD3DSY9_9LAMI
MTTISSIEQHIYNLTHQVTPSKHTLSFPWSQKQPEPEIENSKTEQIYVHPLVKRSSHSLSLKSLEMCTESLGSESGNDIISNLDEFYHHRHHAFEKQSSCRKNQEFPKKIIKTINFPPPLTSINRNEGVRVISHREDGRLVIKASNFSSCNNYFKAERENGRLKLSFLRDSENDELEQSEEQEQEEEEYVNEVEKDCCDDESGEEGDFNGRYWGENNVRDDGGKIGCKINGGDWSGGGRCIRDRSSRSKRLTSLPFCVAIS